MKTLSCYSQLLPKSLALLALSSGAWLMGFSQTPSEFLPRLTLGSAAHAQDSFNYSEEEIRNYARAVLVLESRRHTVINEIKKIVGEVPRIVCDEPTSFNGLSGNAPQLAVSYCDQAKRTIEAKGLTVSRFNEMTRLQQNDARFRQRIQSEISKLLESGGS